MPAKRYGRRPQTTPLYARKTTQLPSKLKDELVSLGKIPAPKSKRQNLDPTTAAGRKLLRKQERQSKGVDLSSSDSRQASRGSVQPGKPPGNREEPVADRKGKKRQQLDEDVPTLVHNASKKQRTEGSDSTPQKKTPLQQLLDKTANVTHGGKSLKKSRAAASGSASTIEEQEDAEIAWLEAQLGIGKSSKSRKEFEEDGLDGEWLLQGMTCIGRQSDFVLVLQIFLMIWTS